MKMIGLILFISMIGIVCGSVIVPEHSIVGGSKIVPPSVNIPNVAVQNGNVKTVENQIVSPDIKSPDMELATVQRDLNMGGGTWTAGNTSKSGLTESEKISLLGAENEPFTRVKPTDIQVIPSALPSSYDLRSYNGGDYTTPVKDQKSCGSCWAFATNAVVESAMELYNTSPMENPDYSEQYLIGTSGGTCGGGWASITFYVWEAGRDGKIGGVKESDWPYTASNSKAINLTGKERIRLPEGFKSVTSTVNTADKMKTVLSSYGSAYVSMAVYNSFYYYKGGIYNKLPNDRFIGNHAVQAIGYGKDNNRDYLICKNSWGTGWGEAGFFKIYMDQPGIMTNAYHVIPVVGPTPIPTMTVIPTATPTPVPTSTPVPTPTITVMPTPTPGVQLIPEFTALTNTTVKCPGRVSFKDLSSGDMNKWMWLFYQRIDNSTSRCLVMTSVRSPTIPFSKKGQYDVELSIKNSTSGWVTLKKYGYVNVI